MAQGGWPLVGRDKEYAQVCALLADPDARGVVLAGPSGVGKTRLGTESLAATNRRVVRVSATRAAASIPLGAFAAYLPAAGLEGTADHSALRLAADSLVDGTGDGMPPVVFVDDAHALDDASAALLLHLGVTARAFLLVTLRTGESAPDALRLLWKDYLERIDLQPLGFDEVVQILQTELGGAVEASTAHAIHNACEGNALYLRELLAGLVESGAIESAGGVRTLRGPITAPPRLVELVAERLEGLTGRERLVLETLALIEPLGLQVVDRLGWLTEWGSLEAKGLVEVRQSGRRRQLFGTHPLHAEVLRATITTRRRNAILSGTAQHIASYGMKRRDDRRRVAVFQLEAGEQADADVLLSAARDARLTWDHGASERFARAALDAGGGAPAALVLGLALDNLGRHEEAEVYLERAEHDAVGEAEVVRAALARSDNLFRGMARADAALGVVTAAAERAQDPVLRDELIGQRALFAFFAGDVAAAIELTDPLLARPDDTAYCIAALPAAMARVLTGRVLDAIEISRRAFETRLRLSDAVHLGGPGVYLVAQAMALTEAGRLDEALGTATFSYEVAASEQERNGMAWLATAIARVNLLSGRLAQAIRFGREAAMLFGEIGHPGARWGYALVACAAGQLGDADVAEEALADLDTEPATIVSMMDTEIERARSWALAARGDLPRARAAMLVAADQAEARELYALEALLLHDIARLGDAGAVAGRLTERAHTKRVDGELMDARVAFVDALARTDGRGLDAAADAFEALGTLLFAAEAANEAAIAHRQAGETRAASASAHRATALAEACGGARTPSLLHGTGSAVLTKREREVATLASHGLSSKEIASTLFVSTRTVDNHLQHAYEKLGVSSRAELPDALARAGY